MSDIYIESLHVKNVRLFSELNMPFNRKFNFLAGPNGCGKTSALACIAHCFQQYSFEYSRYGKDAEFWVDMTKFDQHYRVGLGKGSLLQNEYRKLNLKQWGNPLPEQHRISLNSYQAKDELKFIPLFIGARRNISYQQISGIQREKTFTEALDEYTSNNIRSLYGEWQTNIKQWIINRYFITDKEWAVQEKQNWERFKGQLPKIAPFNSNFSYIETRNDFEPVFSLYGKRCYLEELSAGYQAVLSLIVDIFAWIESTMEGENRIAGNAHGTVLIDEPDIHLHPEWQLTLREGLVNLFPSLQFIITTHSPHMLASAGAGEVIVMPKAYTDEVYNLTPNEKSFSGWQTDDILRYIMGVESLDNKLHARLVKEALKAGDEKNTALLENKIEELKRICRPDDPIITALTFKLASLEAVGND